MWATSDEGMITRSDPLSDEVNTVAVGGAPRGIALGAGAVWVSVD